MMNTRGSGILLHVTSLPSPCGIGDLGPGACRFVDFLADAGQRFWEILPLSPTLGSYGHSPYSSFSAFAGNPLLISPELLCREGLLNRVELEEMPVFPGNVVDYGRAAACKEKLLSLAFERFRGRGRPWRGSWIDFTEQQASWLEDYALFAALKGEFPSGTWAMWPPELRDRKPAALSRMRRKLALPLAREKFVQYIFDRQWSSLREYCRQKGLQVIGDLPIYMAYDSADVWANPELFFLGKDKKPLAVGGVPPDLFCKTGQLWGNPVYRWDVLKESGYCWWKERFRQAFRNYDWLRIDHFRGFVAYWEVPAGAVTAESGQWKKAPADDFFRQLYSDFPCLPIIAEDLGEESAEVWKIMDRYDIPGMRPLLFAFGDSLPDHPCAPHNISENTVVYTGTHDLNTVRGWFCREATRQDRKRLYRYLGSRTSASRVPWDLIRLAMMSAARLAVFPLQDVLGLDETARMNRPGTVHGNWQWRVQQEDLGPPIVERLRELTEIYGRL
jgi:4-alpha-glucanotransferase